MVYNQLYLIKRDGSKVLDEAVNFCSSFGMRLPTPLDHFTNSELTRLGHGSFWLGVWKEQSSGRWIDMYTGEPLLWSYFSEDNSAGDHAVHVSTNGGMWQTTSKDTSFNTICIHGE